MHLCKKFKIMKMMKMHHRKMQLKMNYSKTLPTNKKKKTDKKSDQQWPTKKCRITFILQQPQLSTFFK